MEIEKYFKAENFYGISLDALRFKKERVLMWAEHSVQKKYWTAFNNETLSTMKYFQQWKQWNYITRKRDENFVQYIFMICTEIVIHDM